MNRALTSPKRHLSSGRPVSCQNRTHTGQQRPNVSQPYFLHCPLFLRSCIVIWHHELQLVRACPTFPLLQMLIQVLTSQLTANAGGANTTDSPQTSSIDSNA